MQLNQQQLESVHYIGGPCLVLAGAGSGKTRVITEKIIHLITDCGYSPYNIFAVTFTNKAAREMKDRIASSLSGERIKGLHVSTFHSLGLDILRQEYQQAGLKQNFTLFDEYDQLTILKDIVQKVQENICDKDALKETCMYWQNKISSFKNELLSCDDIDTERVKYLLVDEYQDTNASQYELIKLLVHLRQKFTVVGDDDQSIYSWRGARPQNITLLRQDFPELKVIMLEQNYRSCGRILKCANKLIASNSHEFTKNLHSEMEYGKPINVVEIKDANDEGRQVVTEILAHNCENKSKFSDYAILYRSNYQSREIQKSLRESNIPFRVVGGTSFFAQSEIKDFMSYLRVIANDDDDKAFLRIINIPKREIGPVSLSKLDKFAQKHYISLFESCNHAKLAEEIGSKPAAIFRNFYDEIQEIRHNLNSINWEDHLKKLSETIGYTEWLYSDSGNEKSAEIRIDNVHTLLEWCARAMTDDDEFIGERSINDAINKLCVRELLDRNEQDYELDEVQLMTLHSSKGLEFPYVILIGMEEGILPHEQSIADDNIEEERRLAYVGITRARKELILMYCKNRRSRNRATTSVEPSRFLFELPEEDLHWPSKNIDNRTPEEKQQNMDNLFDTLIKALQ